MDHKIHTLLIVLCGVFACSPNGQKKTVELIPDTTFTELNDSSFIPRQIVCMDVNEGNLYFSDYDGSIVILDAELKIKKRIGSRGEGPGEFLGAAHFYIGKNDSLYVFNEGKRALELFVKDEYVKHIPFPKETLLSDRTRFFLENQLVFHSSISDSLPVVLFDENSDIKRFVCNYTPLDKPSLKFHSARHLVKADQCFFVIGYTLPIFQRYSFDGRLTMEYDLGKIPEIKKKFRHYKNTPQIPNSYAIMIDDVYYKDQKIYLLVSTHEDTYFCNTVCVLDVSDEPKHIGTFKLKGDIYESFCITESNLLIAFNIKEASLDVFTLFVFN
jgi:hypothetical protein